MLKEIFAALGWVRPVTGELKQVTLRQLFLDSLTEGTTHMLPTREAYC